MRRCNGGDGGARPDQGGTTEEVVSTPARPKSVLVKAGDAAKAKAERALLLKTLRASDWSLSETCRVLRMGNASSVLRALDKYGARHIYEARKKSARTI